MYSDQRTETLEQYVRLCLKGDFILLQVNMECNVEGRVFIYDILQCIYRGEDIEFKLRYVFAEHMVRSISANCRIVAKILLA